MARHTSPRDLPRLTDTTDLEHLIQDKRAAKRANPAKSSRRQRRDGKRLLKGTNDEWE